MKIKRVLRFYFFADGLEKAFNNIIINGACASAGGNWNGEYYAEKLCRIIGEKQELSGLWGYIDGIIKGLSEEERLLLEGYAAMRCGLKRAGEQERKAIKRAAVKFERRARRLESFANALELVNRYYCLIAAGG